MRIELAAPGSMPGLLDLNTLAVKRGGEVAADLFVAVDAGVDITNMDVDSKDEEEMVDLLEQLRGAFYPYANNELEAELVTFRGVALATNLATRLTQTDRLGTNYGHLPGNVETDLFAEAATRSAHRYLAARTQLDLFIGNFVHLIDPDTDRAENARLLVGHQFLAIDRHMQDIYSQKTLSEGVAQIRQWDGILPSGMLSE